uniref:Uncharacterized protein n=1 Tax=Triticum urartu TaxID=4572 RepID=A0A8R7P4Y3_TRIUA
MRAEGIPRRTNTDRGEFQGGTDANRGNPRRTP